MRSQYLSASDRDNVKAQFKSLESTVKKHIDLALKEHGEARERLQELEQGDGDNSDEEMASKEVEERLRLLETDQVSSGVIFAQARTGYSDVQIGNVETVDFSSAEVGLPASVVGRISLRLGNVRTANWSTSKVGVFRDISM